MPDKHTNPNITLTVVVSGQGHSVTVNVHETVAHIVLKALHESGNQGQPPADWELRKVDGALLDQSLRISDAGLVDGMTLFLAPRAGVAG